MTTLLTRPSRLAPLLSLAACFGIALLALYRPLFHTQTHLTGTIVTDYFHFHWNYWWVRHALASGLDVYQTSYVFAPYTSSLVYHTLALFWFPLWALIEPLGGTVAAVTAIFVAAYTLAGWSFYTLLRREGVSPGLALVGGAMLELSPLLANAAYWTMLNILGWFWLPVLLLTWGELSRAADPRRLWFWAALVGLTLWAMVLTDLQYPLFAAFLIVPYGLWTLLRAADARARLRLIGAGVMALAVALMLLWFIGPLPALLAFDRSVLVSTRPEQAIAIRWPWGFLWHIDEGVPLGAVVLPLVALALIWGRRIPQFSSEVASHSHKENSQHQPTRWFWLALMLPPLILAAGSSITLGDASIPMPYTLLHNLLGGQFRYPERFGPVLLIPAALFALKTLTMLMRQCRHRWLIPTALLLLVIADARLYDSVPIQPLPPHYTAYDIMGGEPYDYVVIESPTGASTGESLVGEQRFAALQWYGIFHGKRMVNGHISRADVLHFYAMRTDDPLLSWLGQRRFLDPALVEPELRRIIPEWPVGYIVIHQDMIGRDGPTVQEIVGYLNTLDDLLCPPTVERDLVVYRTAWHPDGCGSRRPPETEPGVYTLDLGREGDETYIGWGWHRQEDIGPVDWRWAGEYPDARLYLDLPPGAYTVEVTAQAFWEARTLRLSVDGVALEPGTVRVEPDALQTFTFTLPAAAVGQGRHLELRLTYDAVIVPAEIGQSADPRQLSLAVDRLVFRRMPGS
ncbi:MAG: hypothetical protein JNM70_16580 [Anaerolineae bacterium]|nr:hypothetical protein [Anaerolineae bacterium]